ALSLTEAEEDALICEDEETDELLDQLVAHSLVGTLLTDTPYNPEAFKNTMRSLWKPSRGLVVREIENNIFVFQFFSKADREKVLDQGPWSFDDRLLLLKEDKKGDHPTEMKFNITRFWVKAYQIPVDRRKKLMAMAIANRMGVFVDFDGNDPFGYRKYMRASLARNRFRGEYAREMELKLLEDFKHSLTHSKAKLKLTLHERLDRMDGNKEWVDIFPLLTVYHLNEGESDHLPIKLTEYKSFEDFWLTSNNCGVVVEDVWQGKGGADGSTLPEKLELVSNALKKWS
ncbi:UDP-N-acetylmuramoyl-L-alanyl-D-glutamate--LD-lysine ligase, partial [Bienertia sinuspersici]